MLPTWSLLVNVMLKQFLQVIRGCFFNRLPSLRQIHLVVFNSLPKQFKRPQAIRASATKHMQIWIKAQITVEYSSEMIKQDRQMISAHSDVKIMQWSTINRQQHAKHPNNSSQKHHNPELNSLFLYIYCMSCSVLRGINLLNLWPNITAGCGQVWSGVVRCNCAHNQLSCGAVL